LVLLLLLAGGQLALALIGLARLRRWRDRLEHHPRIVQLLHVAMLFGLSVWTKRWYDRIVTASLDNTGLLDVAMLARHRPRALAAEYDLSLFLMLSTAAALWGLKKSHRELQPRSWVTAYLYGLLGFQLLAMPVAYAIAYSDKSFHYPLATFETSDHSMSSDLRYIVLTDDKQFLLYKKDEGFRMLARDSVTTSLVKCSNSNILWEDECKAATR
jgi:hypothetical protein